MSTRIIESMRNFKYFKKLRKTRKKPISEFFSSFFLNKSPEITEEKKPIFNFIFRFHDYKSLNLETSEDIFIKELQKNESDDTIIKNNISTFYKNAENNKRNINIMKNILMREKKCRRYFKFYAINEDMIEILLSYSKHLKYNKDSLIFSAGSRPTEFYYIIRGKISLKTTNQDYIRREINRNQIKVESLYTNIKVEEKFNLLNQSDDAISVDKFVSKTNFIHAKGESPNSDYNIIPKFISSKGVSQPRRSLNRATTLRVETFFKTHNNLQDTTSLFDSRKLLEDLSVTVKTYSKGDFFCDWDIIFDKPHGEAAYAEEDTDLLVLPKKYFDKYFSKHFLRNDNERKSFLTKRIEFLHFNNVVNLKHEFYDKNNVIYTIFDKANEFFVVYKGKGALMELNYEYNYKKKSEILYNASDLKILCYVAEGCIVGLESFNDGEKNYENNFVILEDNTIIYRIKMNRINDDNYLKKKNKNKLKKQLNDMYLSQNQFLPKISGNKRLTSEEKKFKKKEEKLNYIFDDAKSYFSKRLFNEKRVNTVYGDLKQISDMKQYLHEKNILSKKTAKSTLKKLTPLETESSPGISNFRRKDKFHFLTTINKNKVLSEGGNKNQYQVIPFKNNLKNALQLKKEEKTENQPENNNNSNKKFSKRFSVINFQFKSNLFRRESRIINEPIKDNIKESNKEENFFDFYGDINNDSLKTPNMNKKKKLGFEFFDKYITKTIKINKKNINYNSGNFRIPLFGSKKSKK